MANIALRQILQNGIPVSPDVLEKIAGHFEERTLAKNEIVLESGKISTEYFFLESGSMRAFTFDAEGNEVTTNFFSAPRFVFEPTSFFLRIPSTETFQALSECRVHVLTFEKLNHLFHSVQEFREFGRGILVKEFALFKQRTLGLINLTAEERYANLIRSNKEIFEFAPLKQIASYLGITDTSLSRIRREFPKK